MAKPGCVMTYEKATLNICTGSLASAIAIPPITATAARNAPASWAKYEIQTQPGPPTIMLDHQLQRECWLLSGMKRR